MTTKPISNGDTPCKDARGLAADGGGGLRLYELSAQWRALQDAIEESGGEITELVEHRLGQIDASITNKVQGICWLIKQWEAEAEIARAEADRIRGLALERDKRADGLRGYLLRELQAMGRQKVETPTAIATVCKNTRPSIRCEGDVPEGFAKVAVSFDGTKAYEAWKRGEQLPANVVVEQGAHVRIK